MKILPDLRRLCGRVALAFWVLAWSGSSPVAAQLHQRAHAVLYPPRPVPALSNKPFSIQWGNGNAWLVKPSGERFFSLGVNCVDRGVSRKQFDQRNPGYAAWQHYPDADRWAGVTLGRLKAWEFTTIGGWSDFHTLRQRRDSDVAFTPVLHIGSTAGAPWLDMWDPKIIGRMDQVARAQILALRDDPRLLGYYSDNEIGWWNAALFKVTLEQASTSGQRRRLMQLLQETYHSNWAELVKDFEPEGVGSWEDLRQHGMLHLRAGGNGIHTTRQFLKLLAERYYSLVHEIIRKYDQRALILGDRYQSFFYPEVARASAPFVDAVSTNLNATWNEGTFPRFYLETLHGLTGKPILISEFYMAARENRSGNKNDHGIFPVVTTQQERATGFRNTLHALLRIPYVIGADWFQYSDEPTHGRADGENFNFGLVDIHDRPYQELVQAASALDLAAGRNQPAHMQHDASQGVPRAPSDPLGQFRPTLALKDWDRDRGFISPNSPFPVADLYLCWSENALYLGLYFQDLAEDEYYRKKIVPEGDRAAWTIAIHGPEKAIRSRIGAGREPAIDEPGVRIVNPPGLNAGVGNVVAMELPAKVFGKEQFQSGDKIDFTSTLVTHGQAYRVEWKGSFVLQ